MANKDYYKILGVDKSSSKEEIKKAYKKLALKYHPDRVAEEKKKESEEKFKEISEAYAVLSNEEKRKNYDAFGHSGFNQRYSQEDIFRGADFSNIFEEIFGGGFFGESSIFSDLFGRNRIRRGRDLQYNLTISFEEAAFGCEKELNIKKNLTCEKCGGTGAEKGELISCEKCGGTGQIRINRKTPFGIFTQATFCPKCNGTGKIIKKKCKFCDGKGIVNKKIKIKIKIPAGIDDGQALRVQGKGEEVKEGKSGDLLVVMNIKPHKFFKRQRNDIYFTLPISFSQAALGDEIKIPTLYGDTKIKIPSGIESGKILRLKNKGIENIQGFGKGDEFVNIKIETPKKLTRKQKKLFKELASEEKN